MNEVPIIYVVDDEASVRKAVSRLLRAAGMESVGFDSPEQFLAGYEPRALGCLILDMAMPGHNGLDLQRSLRERGSDLPIIFLTGRSDVPMTVQAMKGGAIDFLTKPVQDADLLAAIRQALEKGRRERELRAERTEIETRLSTLTPREREVLEHVVSGKLNKQIAGDLGTAEKTVKVHRARVMEKMQVDSLAELVRQVERAGVEPAFAGGEIGGRASAGRG